MRKPAPAVESFEFRIVESYVVQWWHSALACGVVYCSVVWYIVVVFGGVWCGVVWYIVVVFGVVWCGVVWCGVM